MTQIDHVFVWLQKWYKSQRESGRDNEFGIIIETVDNPGWYLTINLTGTELEHCHFDYINFETSETDWYYCQIKNKNFDASCSPYNLTLILQIFREWVEAQKKLESVEKEFNIITKNVFDWLQNWYYSQCDGDWEHLFGVFIKTVDHLGWSVVINLSETDWEDIHFDSIKYDNSETDWYDCKIRDSNFEATCSATNLTFILQIFRDWIEKNFPEK